MDSAWALALSSLNSCTIAALTAVMGEIHQGLASLPDADAKTHDGIPVNSRHALDGADA